MTAPDLMALRAPFADELIGKLPRITCPACSKKNCDKHQRSKCRTCKNYITSEHIHIDYVGHADVTDRLLAVDPAWMWEPMGFDDAGLPAVDTDAKDNPVGLWIKLTVLGVTRFGYGSCPSSQADAIKVLIGDAIRNAAMRFGVALDLWAKGERADPTAENVIGSGANPAPRRSSAAREAAAQDISVIRSRIAADGRSAGFTLSELNQKFTETNGVGIPDGTQEQLEAFLKELPQPEPEGT
jgi:hypothetical protein